VTGTEDKNEMAERTCIVTREACDPDQLIRFVAGPDGQVVPDLKRKLPGRGVWVTARRSIVEKAVQNKAFARGFKRKVDADEDLPDLVDRVMQEAALGALGFARKAGECVTGAGKVEAVVSGGKALGLLHASDGAADGMRKLFAMAYAAQTKKGRVAPIWRVFTSMQLDLALGATNVIHAALTKGDAARNSAKSIARLAAYRETDQNESDDQIETADAAGQKVE